MAHVRQRPAKHTLVTDALRVARMTPLERAKAYPRLNRNGCYICSSHGNLLRRIGEAILELPDPEQKTLRELEPRLYLKVLREFVAQDGRPTTRQERITSVRLLSVRFGNKEETKHVDQ